MPVYLPGHTLGGLGFGGASYGFSPAILAGPFSIPTPSIVGTGPYRGGYGGAPYGLSTYGSIDWTSPQVTAVSSLNGFEIEVFFSKAMADDSLLFDPTNYSITALLGVPITPLSVAGGAEGEFGGYTSVILTHTGSTLGGSYELTATNIIDLELNPIIQTVTGFLTFGDVSSVQVSLPVVDTGDQVQLDFIDSRGFPQPILPESSYSPGVDFVGTYVVEGEYPILPSVPAANQDLALQSRVIIDVDGMTSITYQLLVGPSEAYDYLGDILPDDSTQFSGVELGIGVSSASILSGLLLTKSLGDTYGWQFIDISGYIVPTATFRVDFHVDASTASISPPVLDSTLAVLSICDWATQVDVYLGDSLGTKILTVVSGGYTGLVAAAWDAFPCVISLVRNKKADFYTLLLDGTPLITFPVSGASGVPTFPAGAQVLLGPQHAVTLFKVREVKLTASSTLFTSAWNFIHGLTVPFVGSAALTRDRIITKRGPIVRGWGDPTPAEKQDVEVRVNGIPVEVAGVNPYVGEIYPLIPIPLTPSGTNSVEVDYIWFSNPAFELSGLNTRGLGLNVWDRSVGHTAGSLSPLPSNSTGAVKGNRFPMGIALGPYVRPSPKQIAHRYIGFQKGGYSALLNEPTTLLLNRNPHAISIGKVTATTLQQVGSFNGKTLPQAAGTPWSLVGVDSGGLVGDGSYRIIDTLSGPYGVGQSAYYRRELDLSLKGVVNSVGRFKVETWTPDGVFTGVGFGVYSGNHLFFVGALEVSGVKHVGILLNGEDPQLEGSWKIGPSAIATALSNYQISISSADFPTGISSGSRFRISSGSQAGTYTIAPCGISAIPGKILLTLTTPLPANPSLYGNSEFGVFFEVGWEDLITVRAQISYLDGAATAYVGGAVSGLIGEVSALPAYPAQTSLILPALEVGVSFWGSVSRRAKNSSLWDFVQYVYTPERVLNTVQGLTVNTEMGVVPQEDPNDPWFIRGGYGYAEVQPSGNQTIIKSTSAPSTAGIDLSYSYERVEPYFNNKVTFDLDSTFQVESGRLGAGDAEIVLNDGVRNVTFKTLLYVQGTYPIGTGTETGRRLIPELPEASVSGLQAPEDVGWAKSGITGDPVWVAEGQKLYLQKNSTSVLSWNKEIPDPNTITYQGLISEAVIQIVSGTSSGTLGIGLVFGCRVRNTAGFQTRLVLLGFSSGEVRLLDRNYNVVTSFPFAWEDGETHTYRMLIDPNANIVVVMVDDVLLGSNALNLFLQSSDLPEARLEMLGSGSFEANLYSTSCIPLRPVAKPGSLLGRTFGVLLKGGDPTVIDGYKIPRFDTTEALNSSLLATPVPMDWRNPLWVRLYLDPTWGVCFYRPDIPPPPWSTGEYATQTTNPSEAWVSVEYSDLPVNKKARGTVQFGSPNPQAITQSRWDFLRYKIRGDVDGFGIAPQNMVLNRAFTFTSGEFLKDTVPEVKTITSRTNTLVVVSDCAIYASRVYVVQVDGVVLPSTNWSFDPGTQILVLNTPLVGNQHPVTVTFAAGAPYTKEYLCSQPLLNSPTILNSGTPPVPKSRDESFTSSVQPGSQIQDPTDVLDPEESPAPPDFHQFIGFQDSTESLYAGVEFCEKEEGEDVHITPFCDGPGPGLGFAEMDISGSFTSDAFSVEGGPGGTWGGRSPVVSGSSSRFNQSTVLMASGGSYLSGVLGPVGIVLYPNARSQSWGSVSSGVGSMGMNQDFALELKSVTPYEEVWEVYTFFVDNVPPTSADPNLDPNPDGIPGTFGHGAVAYIISDDSSSPYSRLGPWAGLADLSVRSLLGGSSPLSGIELTLEGGTPLPIIVVETSGVIQAAN